MTATVALIDYGSGNLRSAAKALTHAAEASGTGHEVTVTADAEGAWPLRSALSFPASARLPCMRRLSGIPGMMDALRMR